MRMIAALLLGLTLLSNGAEAQGLKNSFKGLADFGKKVEVEKDTDAPSVGLRGPDRMVCVIGCNTPSCLDFETKLYALIPKLKANGWRVSSSENSILQVIDIRNPDEADLAIRYFNDDDNLEMPILVKIEGNEIVREFGVGCGRPLNAYTLWWLCEGKEFPNVPDPVVEPLKQVVNGHYPVRGSWWSHPGDIRSHLVNAPQHRGKFDVAWMNSLSVPELKSLHSDDHEGRVKWQFVNKYGMAKVEATKPAVVQAPKPQVQPAMVVRPQRVYYQNYCPNCPNYRR